MGTPLSVCTAIVLFQSYQSSWSSFGKSYGCQKNVGPSAANEHVVTAASATYERSNEQYHQANSWKGPSTTFLSISPLVCTTFRGSSSSILKLFYHSCLLPCSLCPLFSKHTESFPLASSPTVCLYLLFSILILLISLFRRGSHLEQWTAPRRLRRLSFT